MSIEQNYSVPFVAALALREKQIQQNYRPIIAVHKWFARRPGSLFRGLLLSEFIDRPVEQTYFKANNIAGITVADPFMGGGTPLLEANRLGCDVVGTDINPMAAWIVREELDAINLSDYEETSRQLLDYLAREIGSFYKTRCPITGSKSDVKYFLWVKTGICVSCGQSFDLFPGYKVAENVRHPSFVFVCRECGELREVDDPNNAGRCSCGTPLISTGPVKRNKCACSHCGHTNCAPFRGDGPPSHRLFAIEYHNPDLKGRSGRLFKKPDADDLAHAERADKTWSRMKPNFVPEDPIPKGDETNRLHRWGYQEFSQLFNSRQLMALETVAQFIAAIPDERLRRAFATNFSDLLRYQNMLCRYDTMALKSLDIFSIHGFPVGYVQAESNFIGIRNYNNLPVGSGGWINVIDKYIKAKRYCMAPFEVSITGKKKTILPISGEWIGEINPYLPGERPRIVDTRCASATSTTLAENSLDGVFTDPPYYGMVQYGELMQFCYVWLRKLMGATFMELQNKTTRHSDELTGNNTAARDLKHFAEGLAQVYSNMATALRPGAPLIFTYHHNQQSAYLAAGMAILDANLTCSASLPCPAEMSGSIHIHGTTSSIVDTVFVCRDRGTIPRHWLFHNAQELANIMELELEDLRSAGMTPSAGDIRCIAFGHITRMAVWNLRPQWNAHHPTEKKLAIIREAMDTIATVDDLKAHLDTKSSQSTAIRGGLFANHETRKLIDAVAF